MSAKDWDAAHRPAPKVPHHELPSLQGIADSDQRFFLTMYLRGAAEKDQDEARRRCDALGIDYKQAKKEADRT